MIYNFLFHANIKFSNPSDHKREWNGTDNFGSSVQVAPLHRYCLFWHSNEQTLSFFGHGDYNVTRHAWFAPVVRRVASFINNWQSSRVWSNYFRSFKCKGRRLGLLLANPCGGGLEYLHRNPASLKRRQKGNLVPGGISGTLKYGLESRGTQTREGLRWRGSPAIVNYRPVLSSERALHNNKPTTV
jgi:hypothetical protein